MTLFPRLHTAWLNGWILLVIYGLVFGVTVRCFPKDVVARLYDKSHWPPTQRIITTVGKVLSISEEFFDPDYPFPWETLRRLKAAGFVQDRCFGNLWLYTMNVRKPLDG